MTSSMGVLVALGCGHPHLGPEPAVIIALRAERQPDVLERKVDKT